MKHTAYKSCSSTKKGAAGQATPSILSAKAVRCLSVGLRLKVHGRVLAATVDFEFEIETITFIQGAHAGAFYGADVHERVGLAVVALDEAEALHGVEELDRAAGALTRELALRAAIAAARTITEAACAGFARRAIGDGERFALDLEVGCRHLAAAIDQREAELLTFGQAGQARLLDSANVDEYVFRAIVTDDEAETLLAVEELDHAGAFTDDLGGHAAATAAATAEAATTAAKAAAATTAAAAEAAAVTAEATTAAAAKTITAETATAKATAITAEAAAATLIETFVAETVALVLAAPAAATSIKTHALLVTFASPQTKSDKHVGRMTCRIHR